MTIESTAAEAHMWRAIELALKGQGLVEPNPMVGAVIVDRSGRVIGEGWHQQFGGPHAEINALAQAGQGASGATLYVTLEPCCHFGKTPPCSKAVIAAGIRRVVIATGDPAVHVDGGGIRELRAAGLDIEVGLLESEAKQLVAPFLRLITDVRPWFHAKWAMTLDGKIASRTGNSRWISNEASRTVAHKMRGRMDAIVVGIGTVIADDPLLTARPAGERTATRIIFDSNARLPLASRLVQSARQIPLIVVVTTNASQTKCTELQNAGAEVVIVNADQSGHPNVSDVAHELGNRRMTNVLIEGGGRLMGAFFDAGLIDEIHAFIASKIVGGESAPSPVGGLGVDQIPAMSSLKRPEIELLDGDIYLHGRVAKE